MKTKLSPSMLSIDFGKVAEQLKLVEDAGTQYIHLDVMDGIFVPNISFGIPVIKSIRKHSNMVFDAHLMIVEPEKYVEEFRKAGADIINFHVEATKYPAEVIQQIKATVKEGGIFLLKGAVKDVAAALSCSQASIYRHLAQLKSEVPEE